MEFAILKRDTAEEPIFENLKYVYKIQKCFISQIRNLNRAHASLIIVEHRLHEPFCLFACAPHPPYSVKRKQLWKNYSLTKKKKPVFNNTLLLGA